jgi:hypothetical protein
VGICHALYVCEYFAVDEWLNCHQNRLDTDSDGLMLENNGSDVDGLVLKFDGSDVISPPPCSTTALWD